MSTDPIRGESCPGVSVGERFGTTRIVTDEDLALAVSLTQGTHPVHVSDDAAQAAGLRGRIFHGAITAAIQAAAIGARFSQDRIALMGQDNRYLLPVYPGDTLEAHWTVVEVKPTRQPARWVLELSGQTQNQHGNVVLESRAQVMWMLPR
ncbi:MAG: MaoC family dehydratase [Hydrogenophaga sp.]